MKSLCKLLLLNAALFQVAVCEAAKKDDSLLLAPAKELAEIRCFVDSSVYNRPLLKGPGNHVPVPLPDGAQVSIVESSSIIRKIEVSPGPRFRRCAEKKYEISELEQAKSLLEFTQIENPEAFLGSKLAVCNTIDEGWYFVFGKKTAYIGYAGPMEKPVAFVGMICE